MPDPTLYLFDGFNVLRASDLEDPGALVDRLAGFVALHGARGVVVFDGGGEEFEVGPLSVRFAPHADDVLERLAAEHRDRESVLVVTSDAAVRGTTGRSVGKRGSRAFLADMGDTGPHREDSASRVRDRLYPETRERLERLRRGG